MELFKIDTGLALWTWIVFGIMYFIIWKFAFPKIVESIKNREETIALAVDNAANIEKRLSDIDKEQAEIIKEAKSRASEILHKTRNQAEILRKELLEKAEQEVRNVLSEAKVKIAEERNAMILSIKSDIADLVCDASEKIIRKSFVSKNDREWAEELVGKL